jgi:hypothetical protein
MTATHWPAVAHEKPLDSTDPEILFLRVTTRPRGATDNSYSTASPSAPGWSVTATGRWTKSRCRAETRTTSAETERVLESRLPAPHRQLQSASNGSCGYHAIDCALARVPEMTTPKHSTQLTRKMTLPPWKSSQFETHNVYQALDYLPQISNYRMSLRPRI